MRIYTRLTFFFKTCYIRYNKMKILDKYLLKEIVESSLSVLAIFMIILSSNTMLRLIEEASVGSFPTYLLFPIIFVKIMQYSIYIIPISLFFGIIIALNKLYVSNEMVIMKLNGYSNELISNVLTRLIIITTLVVMLFNCFITPYTVDIRSHIEHQIIHEQKIYSLQERNFTISNDGSKIIYIDDRDELKKANVFIRSKNKQSSTIDISSGISATESNDDLISQTTFQTSIKNI